VWRTLPYWLDQYHIWSAELLEALELDESKLPEVHPPGTKLGNLGQEAAAATGLPEGLPVFAAGGDGQCAGLGVNCTVKGRAYINLGTAVVSGIWSPEYQYDRAWRTELAAQGEGYIFETCLRSGAFLINWFVDQFVAGGKADASTFAALEAAANQLPIGSDGLLVQPYFAGAMDPHWDASARGIIMGLSASHTVKFRKPPAVNTSTALWPLAVAHKAPCGGRCWPTPVANQCISATPLKPLPWVRE